MRIFISGGSKNGKSFFAENEAVRLAAEDKTNLYYIATMIPSDEEDIERIKRHRASRKDKGFVTLEMPADIKVCDREGTYLLDSVTALLANVMFKDGKIYPDAYMDAADNLVRLCGEVKNIVFVSDFIYSDAKVYDEYTEMYRKGLAYIDRKLARICDRVCEVSYGRVTEYKVENGHY